MQQTLSVNIKKQNDTLIIFSKEDKFEFQWMDSDPPQTDLVDYAVWLFLPIAMTKKMNLHICGSGSFITKINAEKLSEIWSCWLPSKFSIINLSFDKYIEHKEVKTNKKDKDIMFFSSGIDSTYALLNRIKNGKNQDLVTLKGMDYKIEDNVRFNKLIEKTNILTSSLCDNRYFINTNAYNIFKKYKINSTISHAFLLNSIGFMYYKNYKKCIIAADLELFQQFFVFPHGITFATNHFFNSGYFKLAIEGENITRANKLPIIAKNKKALKSISFCVNYNFRPENCGLCSKCIRTKTMFLSSLGYVPDNVFKNKEIIKKYKEKKINRTFLFIHDAYITSIKNKTISKNLWIEDVYKKAKRKRIFFENLDKIVNKVFNKLKIYNSK